MRGVFLWGRNKVTSKNQSHDKHGAVDRLNVETVIFAIGLLGRSETGGEKVWVARFRKILDLGTSYEIFVETYVSPTVALQSLCTLVWSLALPDSEESFSYKFLDSSDLVQCCLFCLETY